MDVGLGRMTWTYDVNNNIGADNSSQILTDLIRFAHSLDQNLTAIICTYIRTRRITKKSLTYSVFLHRIIARKRVKIIPHLCECEMHENV